MTKRKNPKAPAGQVVRGPAPELLAGLPTERAELLAAAVAAVVRIDAAIMRGDSEAAELADAHYDAIMWTLNGGTYFACRADDDAAGRVIERHCAAVPGDVPLWGQCGQFLAEVDRMRVLVDYEAGHRGPLTAHFQFHVVDLDGPFISPTGYRSHFCDAPGCMAVDEVARSIVAAWQAEKKRPVMIEDSYRDRLAEKPLPAWLSGLVPPARRVPATVVIPPGFVLVDVVLPAHKAFIARRWAAAAANNVRAAKAVRVNAKGEARAADAAAPPGLPDSTDADEDEPAEAGPAPPELTMTRPGHTCSTADNGDARSAGSEFWPTVGQRCEIASVHHPAFAASIGKHIVIVSVHPETGTVWAHDDRPITYRTNRAGRRVVDSDPKCIQTAYGVRHLRPG